MSNKDDEIKKTNYIFTQDWFTGNIINWTHFLKELKDKPNLRFLEIGSYQGRSTVWLLENILTHDTSSITCIDTFAGSAEHLKDYQHDLQTLFQVFCHNIYNFKNKSQIVLKQINEQYDFVYIDGDHIASSVIEDAILSFSLLKKGGIMIVDDYEWSCNKTPIDDPKPAIDAFLLIYADKINVLFKNNQVIIEKI